MFKRIFNHKKSLKCEICKKKIKNSDKNITEKQCKECQEKQSEQNLTEKSELNDFGNFGSDIKKILKSSNKAKEENKIINENDSNSLNCYGCKWPIVSKVDSFEDTNENVFWHSGCYEIKKILGLNIPIESYDNVTSNKEKLSKDWSEYVLKLSKILIAFLCDCDYYAFEIVSCIKNKDFNSPELKELVINIIQLIYFLLSTSNKYINDYKDKENNQNELYELFKNIIVFRDSVEKNIIYTINVKKLVKSLSQIHGTIKNEINSIVNSVVILGIKSEFNKVNELINDYENFGYNETMKLTPIYNFKNDYCNYNKIWDYENELINDYENFGYNETMKLTPIYNFKNDYCNYNKILVIMKL